MELRLRRRLLMKMNDSLLLKNPEGILDRLVRDVCEAVNSPKALAFWLLWKHGDHNQMLELKADPLHYLTPYRFADDYLICTFLKKFPGLNLGIDTREIALKNFKEFEDACELTNQELYHRLHSHERNNRIFSAASEKCKRWLPEITGNVMDKIFTDIGWGKGVTSASKGSALSAYNKFQATLEATPNLIAVGAHHLVNSIPMWATYHGSGNPDEPSSVTQAAFVPLIGNTVTTVPKNAKTDRTIAVEPHVNAAFQRGIGRFIRSILLRKGCDLRYQNRNQQLAGRGSFDGTLATLDLKGASDTVSQKLLELLLPTEWVSLFETARSPYYSLNGEWYRYHKHSSMGNGYTFELETLIFYVLALSACEEVGASTVDVSVYGDDIIVPVEAYSALVDVLNCCGFAVNVDKSFCSGPFRESCGADFFNGFNVRPFLVTDEISSVPNLYRVANALRTYSAKRSGSYGYDERFKVAWKNLFLACPKGLRFRCPQGVGDVGFLSELDESAGEISMKMSSFGMTFRGRGIVFVAKRRHKRDRCLTVASSLMAQERTQLITVSRVAENPHSTVKYFASEPPIHIPGAEYALRDVGQWRIRALTFMSWPFRGGWV